MKKRVMGILLAGVLTLSLAGCAGDSNTESSSTVSHTISQAQQSEASNTASDVTSDITSDASDTMDEASYMEKYHALGDATIDFSSAVEAIVDTASAQDLDTVLAKLEEQRAYKQIFYDFAAIDNPPEKYAEIHKRMANACTKMGDVLDEFVDVIKGLFEGTVDSDDYQVVADKLFEVVDEIVQVAEELEAME